MLLISPLIGLSVLAAGALASPYPTHGPMPKVTGVRISFQGRLDVRQDASGNPYVISSDQKLLQGQADGASDGYFANRLSTGLSTRDFEPFCFCKEESGSCIKEEPVVCLKAGDDDEPYNLAQSLVSERGQASFCLCATYGNGTCVPTTEYCKDDSGNPPHQPFCMCVVDQNGVCKEKTSICSDNISPPADDLHIVRKRDKYGSGSDDDDGDCYCFAAPQNSCQDDVWYCNTKKADDCYCPKGDGCENGTWVCPDHGSPPATRPLVKRQGVTGNVPPPVPAPALSISSFDRPFYITAVPYDGKMPLTNNPTEVELCEDPDWLTLNLTDGVLTDNKGRRGYTASNHQLQFDDPPQAGAVYTSGFYMLNGYLGLDEGPQWWSCASGKFLNFYDDKIADYCNQNLLQITPVADDCNDSDAESDSDSD